MPHKIVEQALETSCERCKIPPEAHRKIVAWLIRAEQGDFANKDRDQQLGLILEAMSPLTADGQSSAGK